MALEKGNHVQAAFLDLSKAYSLKWFSSFLQDHTQCVRVNGSLSSVEYLKSGIPQGPGTVLGPVLFLIFINDLPSVHLQNWTRVTRQHSPDPICCRVPNTPVSEFLRTYLPSVVENESSIFADDTTIFTFGEDLAYSCRSMTLDLNAASYWAKVWGMLYNAEKSQHLTVRSKHVRVSSPPISMGGVTVPQVHHHKHLDIHFNKSLTWTDHVNELFSSCARRIVMLRRLRRILPNAAIQRIYVGSIWPILEYACPVWCGGPIAKLVKLQESFCRCHNVTLPPVKKRYDYHTLILFYKIKSNLLRTSACEKTIWLPYTHPILQD